MKVYMAGPLFTAGEQDQNRQVAKALRLAGHEVFLPQEQEQATTSECVTMQDDRELAGKLFRGDVAGIDWADVVVACMDGPDPDSGTCWECGYAYGKKPILVYRSDFRTDSFPGAPYNLMLTESASKLVEIPRFAPPFIVGSALVAALAEPLQPMHRALFRTLRVAGDWACPSLVDENGVMIDDIKRFEFDVTGGGIPTVTLTIELRSMDCTVRAHS